MKIHTSHISYQQTGAFSPLMNDYLNQHPFLKEFITDFPSWDAIARQIETRKNTSTDRALLQSVLREQYQEIGLTPETDHQITKLGATQTFTFCAAHQPVVFGGPLYTYYKIIQVIRLAEMSKKKFPPFEFVPVYYIGSEDHDMEEIGTLYLNHNKLQWESGQQGACGRMTLETLQPLLQEVLAYLDPHRLDSHAALSALLKQAYAPTHTLAQATRIFMNGLFGKYGLVVLDGDHPALKKKFLPVIEEELQVRSSFPLVQETIFKLAIRYKKQAAPRELNLFYLRDGLRERIIMKGEQHWQVLNSDMRFDQPGIQTECQTYPERFSPNVILRPLYQEILLPNLAFVGGGGELSYWMQLKSLFQHYNVAFPVLCLRQSVLWIPDTARQRMQRLALQPADIFPREMSWFINRMADKHPVLNQWKDLQESFQKDLERLTDLGAGVSVNLHRSMIAQKAKTEKILLRAGQKILSDVRRSEHNFFEGLTSVRQELFPGGSLQERTCSLYDLFPFLGFSFIDYMMESITEWGDPFLILEIEGSNLTP